MDSIAFRCDGDDRIGAGHVARCVQIALAFERAGVRTRFIGRYGGVAAALVEDARLVTAEPSDGPTGADARDDPIVLDSYEIAPGAAEELAARRPVAVIDDETEPPAVHAAIHYHVGAERRVHVPAGTVGILGPAYAPVRPACIELRRPRGLRHGLVSVGASDAARAMLSDLSSALASLADGIEVFVAAPGVPGAGAEDPAGFLERIRWADVAISAAGSTPYELACAGVPMVIVPVAEHQRWLVEEFDRAGLAVGCGDPAAAAEAVSRLRSPAERERLAAAGSAAIDGRGADRARDALLAAFAGSRPPSLA